MTQLLDFEPFKLRFQSFLLENLNFSFGEVCSVMHSDLFYWQKRTSYLDSILDQVFLYLKAHED